ncbi:hypothetical protein [Haliangium ochraceum]|uniref:Uncharacterized protein n=1 Tax=Haliangium ochraceum (strain DSM 14365 / JCM 11303 / SMP-2) TaxID=502025 RepID=D0LJT4_HALO1|nr:hypothetical protein [Haliangium ochraceum]ACY18441.1 hypothetical protein Hoch_5966 [Haliangium ochraceum DSM 14365]
MVGCLRNIVYLVVFVALVYLGATVPLGSRTFFGHVRNIWASEETREMVDGIKKSGRPMYEGLKRGVEEGVNETRRVAAEQPGADGADDPDGAEFTGDAGMGERPRSP